MLEMMKAMGPRVLMAMFCLGLSSTAAAESSSGCDAVPGTYVATIVDREGVFSSRGLLTFAAGGVLLVTDSSQGGVPGVWDPFSASQGAWRCDVDAKQGVQVVATALNFVLPADGRQSGFGRVDYEASLDPATGELSGKILLRLDARKDLEAADPLTRPGPAADEFQFDARRVSAGRT